MSGEGLFVTPIDDGRRLYARSLFYREGVLLKGPWILPGAFNSRWYHWLVQTRDFLRMSHLDSVTENTVTAHYTEHWVRSIGDAHAHEYKLMTPGKAKVENEAQSGQRQAT
jgi:hypothetical protein